MKKGLVLIIIIVLKFRDTAAVLGKLENQEIRDLFYF